MLYKKIEIFEFKKAIFFGLQNNNKKTFMKNHPYRTRNISFQLVKEL